MATKPAIGTPTDKIVEIKAPEITDIPFELVSRHDQKTTKLLNNSGEVQPLKSQSKFFLFEFEAPLCITWVVISTTDFIDGLTFNYRWTGPDLVAHNGTRDVKDGKVSIPLNDVATSISFQPPRHYFSKPFIQSVRIFGFRLIDAEGFIRFAQEVENIRDSSIQKIENEQSELEKSKIEVAALQATRGSLLQDIEKNKSQSNREQSKLKNVENLFSEEMVKLSSIVNDISLKQETLERVQSDVTFQIKRREEVAGELSKAKSELTEVQSNLDLFPSELSGFSKQGAKDFRAFLIISILPTLMIAVMFYMLIQGSADLTTKITGSEKINIAALAVSRAPYVTISVTIIGVCYYIAKMLILEMVRISRQRLSLTKISIIAKDISTSIDNDLELDRDAKYSHRLKLKMEMMREHLKADLSKDFQTTLPKNISVGGLVTPVPSNLPGEGE